LALKSGHLCGSQICLEKSDNIATAEDKIKASAKEGAMLSGGLLGSVAGGAVAGCACGPGAPICVSIGVFVGGVMFALGTELAFDTFWR
jgi:hypothetical protein